MRRSFLFFFFACCVLCLLPFFFSLVASSITYLSALRFPYREGVEGAFVFFFFFCPAFFLFSSLVSSTALQPYSASPFSVQLQQLMFFCTVPPSYPGGVAC